MCGRWPVGSPAGAAFGIRNVTATEWSVQGTSKRGPRAQQSPQNKIRHYVQDSECNEVASRRRAFGIRASLLEVLAHGAYQVRTGAAALVVQRHAQHVRGERLKEKLEPGTARQKASDSRSHCSQHDEATKA